MTVTVPTKTITMMVASPGVPDASMPPIEVATGREKAIGDASNKRVVESVGSTPSLPALVLMQGAIKVDKPAGMEDGGGRRQDTRKARNGRQGLHYIISLR